MTAPGAGARRPVVLVGAGGFGRETAEAVEAAASAGERWQLIGLLDDDPARHGTTVGRWPVLGPAELVADLPDTAVVLCAGRPADYAAKERLADRLGLDDDRYATVVHPAASVAPSATVGPGSVLLAQCVLTADVVVGRHVGIMPQVVLTHDVCVADHATLTSGVRLGGGVQVGPGAYLGAASVVREGLAIGAWAMVGLAAVVTRDVPPGRLWYGSPARDICAAPVALRRNEERRAR